MMPVITVADGITNYFDILDQQPVIFTDIFQQLADKLQQQAALLLPCYLHWYMFASQIISE
ncbi:MAG: hypothetical protein KGZ74_15040 [Chitinophagaceae bacterium]|nr:hypothetical protein [Chitinophagaceae bacterium]